MLTDNRCLPLVERSGSRFFDSNLGWREILFRRVGENEMILDANSEIALGKYRASHGRRLRWGRAGNAKPQHACRANPSLEVF